MINLLSSLDAMLTSAVLGNVGRFALLVLLFASSLWLIFLVLIQRGKGGGLTGALGGSGGSSAFGAKAGDAFTKVTVVSATIWIFLCMATIAFTNRPPVPQRDDDSSAMTMEDDSMEQADTDLPATGGDEAGAASGSTTPDGDDAAQGDGETSEPATDDNAFQPADDAGPALTPADSADAEGTSGDQDSSTDDTAGESADSETDDSPSDESGN